jgi:hypothetical protein
LLRIANAMIAIKTTSNIIVKNANGTCATIATFTCIKNKHLQVTSALKWINDWKHIYIVMNSMLTEAMKI